MEARHNGELLFDHECGFTADDPLCILTLDWSNAFNRMGRRAIHRALEEHRPDLLPYFRWAYHSGSPLCLSDGTFICASETGVRQGDPLGPLFFDVAIHPILQRFKTAHKDLLLALGVHDDTTLAGKRSLLVRIVRELTDLHRADNPANTTGMILNLAKTKLWDPSATEPTSRYEGMERVRDGLVFLGGPLGFDDKANAAGLGNFTSDYLHVQLLERREIIARLSELPPSVAWLLLQACINTRPMYLLRTMSPWNTDAPIAEFDAAVDAEVARLAQWQGDLPEVSRLLRGLPQQEGGCSLRTLHLSSTCAYSASLLTACQYIQTNLPQLWNILTNPQARLLAPHSHILATTVPGFQHFDSSGIHFDPPTPAESDDEADVAPRLGALNSIRPLHQQTSMRRAGITTASHAAILTKRVQRIHAEEKEKRRIIRVRSAQRTTEAGDSAFDSRPDGDDGDGDDDDDDVEPELSAPHGDRPPRPVDTDGNQPGTPSFSQATLQARVDQATRATITRLLDDRPHSKAWFNSGSSTGCGHWLQAEITADSRSRLRPSHFVTCLRQRLLLPNSNHLSANIQVSCQCRADLTDDAADPSLHCLSCSSLAPLWLERHNEMRDALFDFLKHILPPDRRHLSKEVALESNGMNTRRTDILARIGPEVYYIDVSVVDPTRTRFHNQPAGTAAKSREREKIRHILRGVGDSIFESQVLPFVIEATGRLGGMARAFIDKLSGVSQSIPVALAVSLQHGTRASQTPIPA